MKHGDDLLSCDARLAGETRAMGYFGARRFGYGTAGFRAHHAELDFVLLRVGIFAGRLARSNGRQAVGVMITASHNPSQDNGVKVFAAGGYLHPRFEAAVTAFVNEPSLETAMKGLTNVGLGEEGLPADGVVLVGRDRRESGPRLLDVLMRGLSHTAVRVLECGLCSTPMLEFFCAAAPAPAVEQLLASYREIGRCVSWKPAAERIIVDCANGSAVDALNALFDPAEIENLGLQLTHTQGEVNHLCGSDHVCTTGAPPFAVPTEICLGASFDGDADRLVLYRVDQGRFDLINGDKLAGLCALFVQRFLAQLLGPPFACAVLTTNYSNAATRDFVHGLGLQWIVCPVGFKHLEAASHEFAVAILFESNGHFKFKISEEFYLHAREKVAEETRQLLELLSRNKCADSVLNLLAFIAMREVVGLTWAEVPRLFAFRAAANYKLKVANRHELVADEVSGVVSRPVDVQPFIDELHRASQPGLRIYIRPSGTEDVLRVLVEAISEEEIQRVRSTFDPFILAHPLLGLPA